MSVMIHRLETLAQVALPALGNLVLAGILLASTQPPEQTPTGPGLPPPPGPVTGSSSGSLPNGRLTSLLATIERSTGHDYECEGPWNTSDGLQNWSCRTTDALVTIRGADANNVRWIDVTWFGFEANRTDLPAWAAATQESPSDKAAALHWVEANAGSHSSGRVAGVSLTLGGARGALSLQVTRG